MLLRQWDQNVLHFSFQNRSACGNILRTRGLSNKVKERIQMHHSTLSRRLGFSASHILVQSLDVCTVLEWPLASAPASALSARNCRSAVASSAVLLFCCTAVCAVATCLQLPFFLSFSCSRGTHTRTHKKYVQCIKGTPVQHA